MDTNIFTYLEARAAGDGAAEAAGAAVDWSSWRRSSWSSRSTWRRSSWRSRSSWRPEQQEEEKLKQSETEAAADTRRRSGDIDLVRVSSSQIGSEEIPERTLTWTQDGRLKMMQHIPGIPGPKEQDAKAHFPEMERKRETK